MRQNGRTGFLLHVLALASMIHGLLCIAGFIHLQALHLERIANSTGGKAQFLTIQGYVLNGLDSSNWHEPLLKYSLDKLPRLIGSSVCIMLSLIQDMFTRTKRCMWSLAFRAMSYSDLARPYRHIPTEKGPFDHIPPGKYTPHYRTPNLASLNPFSPQTEFTVFTIYWSLRFFAPSLIFAPDTTPSTAPELFASAAAAAASAESLASGIAVGKELIVFPFSADLSMHAAPFIVLALDFIWCEPKFSRRQMNRVAPVVILGYGAFYGGMLEFLAKCDGYCECRVFNDSSSLITWIFSALFRHLTVGRSDFAWLSPSECQFYTHSWTSVPSLYASPYILVASVEDTCA